MTSRNLTREDPVPPERFAEAGVWIARLHGDNRDETLEAGFRQWLQAHPLNARAFELTTEVWEDSQNLRRVVPFAHELQPTRKKRFRFTLPNVVLATAAAAATIFIFGAAALYFAAAGVATGIGEQRLLTLEDGSRLYLNTATRIVVHYDENARKIELESGEALFDVARRPDWPFIVQAGDRQVRALGTSFIVRYDEDRTAVTLVEGKVTVAPLTPLPVSLAAAGSEKVQGEVLSPGERLTFGRDRKRQLDRPSIEKATAWRRGQVILDNTPLAGAVREMNRYNAVKLTIEQPQAADLVVDGLFQVGDSMSFANAVAQTYGLRVVERGDEIVLEGSPTRGAEVHH